MSISSSVLRTARLRSVKFLSGRRVIGLALLSLGGMIGCEAPELPTMASDTPASGTPASAPEAASAPDARGTTPELPPEAPAAAPGATPEPEATPAPAAEPGRGEVAPPTEAPAASVPAPSESTDAAAASGDQFPAARAIFSNSCQRCHSVADGDGVGAPDGGPGGGPGRMRGPSLAHVGADPAHDAAWIAAHIRDPKSHNPRSRMPAFASRMGDAEIQQLAEFLASLK
jgi:mono/diheme cytochrome c family protein